MNIWTLAYSKWFVFDDTSVCVTHVALAISDDAPGKRAAREKRVSVSLKRAIGPHVRHDGH